MRLPVARTAVARDRTGVRAAVAAQAPGGWRWASAPPRAGGETAMIPNCRPREGRRDLSFGSALAPLSRPGPLLVAYRWRYELGIVCVLLAGTAAAWQAGPGPALAGLAVAAAVTALAATRPAFRSFAAARAWCVITPHRVRTCFAQA